MQHSDISFYAVLKIFEALYAQRWKQFVVLFHPLTPQSETVYEREEFITMHLAERVYRR
jgi:hypothetical protein